MTKTEDKIYKLSLLKDEILSNIELLENQIKEETYLLEVVYANPNDNPEIEWKGQKDREKSSVSLDNFKYQLMHNQRALADINSEIANLKSMSVINDNNKLYKEHTSFNVEDIDDEELFKHIRVFDNGEMIFHFGDKNAVLCCAELDIPLIENNVIKEVNPQWNFVPSWPVFKEYMDEDCSIKDEYDYIEYVNRIVFSNLQEGYKKKLRVMLYNGQRFDFIERGSKLRLTCEIGLYINKQCTKDFSQIKKRSNDILSSMKETKKYNIDDFDNDIPLYVMKKIYEKKEA